MVFLLKANLHIICTIRNLFAITVIVDDNHDSLKCAWPYKACKEGDMCLLAVQVALATDCIETLAANQRFGGATDATNSYG